MIISWSRGRLGNQFFQYSLALESSRKREAVVLIGFEELKLWFPEHRGFIVAVPRTLQKLSRKLHRFAKRAGSASWIATVTTDGESATIIRSKGRLPVALVIDELAQINGLTSSKWVQELAELNPRSLDLPIQRNEVNSCFIHVRRTDYATWPRPDIPAVLPLSWFQEAMNLIQQVRGDATFHIFTDDPEWVREQRLFDDCELSSDSPVEDWHSMTHFDSGILSPSSFAYWATKIALDAHGATGPFIAPKFWGAWRIREWYPPGLQSSPFSFLEVKSNDPGKLRDDR